MTDDRPATDAPQVADDSGRSPSAHRRLLRGILVFGGVPYAAITLLLAISQRQLLYHPRPSAPLLAAHCGLSGAAADVTTSTADGLTLHGWLIAGQPRAELDPTSPHEPTLAENLPLVIYFPGNASHRGGRISDLCDFTNLGCDVLIFDYRGYAENSGSPSQVALCADGRAIWKFAVDELGRPPEEIVLFGESLGGAVAIDLASRLSQQGTPPAALITNATFDSVPDLAAAHYPWLPLRWLVWDRWSSVERIAAVACPVLMFHGTADTLIPLEHGRRLFAAAPQQSQTGIAKSFVPIQNAGHNDIPVSRLRDEVRQLLSEIVRVRVSSDP